jgi:hypothetical protein
LFFRGSRYEQIADAEIDGPDARTIRYKRMRFIPELRGPATAQVQAGDRADLVAFRTLGDPERFWRLCDVNRIMRPADLAATPGRRLRVPVPGS